MMQQYGQHNVIAINVTFVTNENNVNIFYVSLLHASKSREHFETWWNTMLKCWNTIENCWNVLNMVMFIPISIIYNDSVWQLKEQLSNCVHNHILDKENDLSKWMDVIDQKMQE